MAKGQASKQQVMAIILETFQNAFIDGKDIRIPMVEDGADVQIKVTLTAAKNLVDVPAGDNGQVSIPTDSTVAFSAFPEPVKNIKATDEEKENVSKLLAALNL